MRSEAAPTLPLVFYPPLPRLSDASVPSAAIQAVRCVGSGTAIVARSITTGKIGRPLPLPIASIASSVESPSTSSPKTVCLPSRVLLATNVMKN